MKKKYLALIYCFVIFLASGQKTQEKYPANNFKHFSTLEGLSQRSVVAILQDDEGYLWFGTRYGLNKFDGHSFKNYYYHSNNNNSLSNSRITALAKDNQSNIWVGTKNGLNKYDAEKDNFIRIKTNKGNYLKGEITDIIVDQETLWISTAEGLINYNIESGSIRKYNHFNNSSTSLSSNYTLSLLKAKDGRLWICTNKSIDIFNPKTKKISHLEYPNNQSPLQIHNVTTDLFQDNENNIWLGYYGGLAVFDDEKQRFIDYKKPDGTNYIEGSVRSIHQDKNKNLWIGSYEGLFLIDSTRDKVYNYKHNVSIKKSISQNSVYAIISDTRGDLWVGTWAGGVNYLDRSTTIFSSFHEGSSNYNINYKVVSTIIEGAKKNLWIGTEGGGINFYDNAKKKFSYYTTTSPGFEGLKDNNVKAMLKDYKNNIWVGTHSNGLAYMNLEGEKPKIKNFEPKNNTFLSSKRISALAEDKQHNIWIGTNNGGLDKLDIKSEEISHIPDHNNILGSFIYTIINSHDNHLLVGGERGLGRVDLNTGKIYKISYSSNTNNLSPYGIRKVISLYLESETSLWIGTEGDGLFNYNFKTKTSKRFSINEGLPDEVIYAIVPDDAHNLWLSTNKGLSKLDTNHHTFQNFNLSDGLQGNEFNYGAFLKTSYGELIFGGVNGYTTLDPTSVKTASFIPPLVLKSFKTRDGEVTQFTEKLNEINLSYSQNDISFEYVALSYSQTDKNKYSHRLEGYDTEWKPLGSNKTATYTNLNHGTYQFKARVANSLGAWTESNTTLKINIAPPIWKTWWAYLSYLFLLSGLFFLIRKYSMERIHEKAILKQERKDRERIEEVNRLRLQLFTNISHDFRTPLTLIIGPLKKLIDENKGGEYIKSKLEGMYKNTSILLQLINQLLDYRKIEDGKLKLLTGNYNIIPFIRDIKHLFDELAEEKNITFQFISKFSDINVWFDKIEIKKVIINLLSNAFKHTHRGGTISIEVVMRKDGVKTAEELLIMVSDSGKGIPKEDVKFIFDRYFQLNQKSELKLGTGVGLTLAKDIVELHNGKIDVKSTENQGTTFSIMLPLGNKHLKPSEMISNTSANTNTEKIESVSYSNLLTNSINSTRTPVKTIENEITINPNLNTLLLVEDNIEVRAFIASLFNKKYNVLEAENGAEGLKLAKNYVIDLIISDLMMPEMDGVEFCKTIKTNVNTNHIPVVMLSAKTSQKVQKEGYDIGANLYITKPFDASVLVLQIENLLKSRQKLIEKFKKEIILEPKINESESPELIFLNKVVSIIEENISNSEFMASTLVDKMSMSQSVLYRKLKSITGQSITEFVRMIKLKKAAQLLEQDNLNISGVAYETGFNDLKYFRNCFKKTYGETPSQYRKTKRKQIILQ